MRKRQKVFLGGTVGKNSWREKIVIPALLERGIVSEHIFNPVVLHWDSQAQANEDAAKANPDYLLLFVLASPDPASTLVTQVSGYSLVEAVMALYESPDRTGVLFDVTGLARRTAKGLLKAHHDLVRRFPQAPIFTEYAALIDWVVDQMAEEFEVSGCDVCGLPSTPKNQAVYTCCECGNGTHVDCGADPSSGEIKDYWLCQVCLSDIEPVDDDSPPDSAQLKSFDVPVDVDLFLEEYELP